MAKSPPRKRALALRREKTKAQYRADRRHRAARKYYFEHKFFEAHPSTPHPITKKPIKVIACPETMDLDKNATATLEVIREIHRWASARYLSPTYIDFKPINRISPAAALLLAAELDRWNRLHPKRKMKSTDVEDWNPAVRRLLYEMGFFALLNIEDKALHWDPKSNDGIELDTRFLPFHRGSGADGAAAVKLRDRIETFAGRVRRRMSLYDGLVEAMTNVGHHAYGDKAPLRSWWISASIDKKNNVLVVLCLDHGRGIPTTLPRKHREQFREIISLVGVDLMKDDARMIEAAMELERSSTRKEHRGHGLHRDVRRYISTHNSDGQLKILSNYGVYIFDKKSDGSEHVSLRNLSVPHNGTLIEWVIEDYAEVGDENY